MAADHLRQGTDRNQPYFVMDFAAVWMDIVGGLVIAGAIAAWVPQDFWKGFFLTDHPVLATLWGPIVGPLVAIISFVCSVGHSLPCCGTAASASAACLHSSWPI